MATQWIKDRISATQAQIEAYETALTALISGGAQSYTLDTGQTKQIVTKFDIADMQSTLDALYNRYSVLNARAYGCGIIHGMGGW